MANNKFTQIEMPDGSIYDISGGTEVIANPGTDATDSLTKITIGDVTYDISGNGGSGSSGINIKKLWEGTSNTASETITLNNNISDYDMLYFVMDVYGGNNNFGDIVLTNVFKDTKEPDVKKMLFSRTDDDNYGTHNSFICLKYIDETTIKIMNSDSTGGTWIHNLIAVYGIKFSSGSGGSGGFAGIDTDKVVAEITSSVAGTEWTATEDCWIIGEVVGQNSTSSRMEINGIVVDHMYASSGAVSHMIPIPVKKGQVVKITACSDEYSKTFTAYGVLSNGGGGSSPTSLAAKQVSYDNTVAGLAASNVQSAIDELKTNIPFSLAIDEQTGAYGYIKKVEGADTFVPFKSSSGGSISGDILNHGDVVGIDEYFVISTANTPCSVSSAKLYDNSIAGSLVSSQQLASDLSYFFMDRNYYKQFMSSKLFKTSSVKKIYIDIEAIEAPDKSWYFLSIFIAPRAYSNAQGDGSDTKFLTTLIEPSSSSHSLDRTIIELEIPSDYTEEHFYLGVFNCDVDVYIYSMWVEFKDESEKVSLDLGTMTSTNTITKTSDSVKYGTIEAEIDKTYFLMVRIIDSKAFPTTFEISGCEVIKEHYKNLEEISYEVVYSASSNATCYEGLYLAKVKATDTTITVGGHTPNYGNVLINLWENNIDNFNTFNTMTVKNTTTRTDVSVKYNSIDVEIGKVYFLIGRVINNGVYPYLCDINGCQILEQYYKNIKSVDYSVIYNNSTSTAYCAEAMFVAKVKATDNQIIIGGFTQNYGNIITNIWEL